MFPLEPSNRSQSNCKQEGKVRYPRPSSDFPIQALTKKHPCVFPLLYSISFSSTSLSYTHTHTHTHTCACTSRPGGLDNGNPKSFPDIRKVIFRDHGLDWSRFWSVMEESGNVRLEVGNPGGNMSVHLCQWQIFNCRRQRRKGYESGKGFGDLWSLSGPHPILSPFRSCMSWSSETSQPILVSGIQGRRPLAIYWASGLHLPLELKGPEEGVQVCSRTE